jgi:hypothetical protein
MAIGLNLGDDDDRARRAAEDALWENERLLNETEELKQAFELSMLVLAAVLPVGRGVIIDASKAVDWLGRPLIDHQWFYVANNEKTGITPYPIKNTDGKYKHGMILENINKPAKLGVVRGR